MVHTDDVSVLRRSTRESLVPKRYGFVGLTSQLDNDLKTYGEAMSDINSDKLFEAMKSEMDSMGSNQVWTLVDPPKGVRPVECKWVYKRKLGADGEVTAFKARLVAKGYTQLKGAEGTVPRNRRNRSNKKIKTQQRFKAIKTSSKGCALGISRGFDVSSCYRKRRHEGL
ncbi:UNVERIFIED_CONTAM: hypothetical protein Slati_3751800 [Sesamum latifolium]|uniref:Reverse transcriptase Ty1/copia-type domain-containing protein n=1 Tax=Sesamum latifolium TaxID=2727402 RepID=A0AAW2U2S2_9LAMI